MTPQQLHIYVEGYAHEHEISVREAIDFLARRRNVTLIAELLGVTSDPPRQLSKDIQTSIDDYFAKQGYLITKRKKGA